jgi:alpha-methylacyl-CoA racemase
VTSDAVGPLANVRVVELAGIGPAPFCCMLLADMGADVVRVDRFDAPEAMRGIDPRKAIANRGRRTIAVDLKRAEGVETVLRLVANADVLVEGFRPGVTERMGLGPETCLALNPKLVYGRMTGWGQDGPLAQAAGHDINYIALAGALHTIGERGGPPISPLNYVGDFGGGSLYLALGILAALVESRQSGRGQVVDASIVDGVASLMTFVFTQMANGRWSDERGSNLSDGSRPWYAVYETLDGRYISIGPIEQRFYDDLVKRMGLAPETLPNHDDAAGWDRLREVLRAAFRTRTRDEWCRTLEGTDTCLRLS